MQHEPLCMKCGVRFGSECHHIKARADGGGDELSNLAWLCRECHEAITRAQHKRWKKERKFSGW